MAVEFFDGFSSGVNANSKPEWSLTAQPNYSTTNPRTGVWRMATNNNTARLVLPATAKKTVGFALYTEAWFTSSGYALIAVLGDTQATTHLWLHFDSTGHLVLRRGTGTGTIIATSANVFPLAQWRYLELQATISDTVGTCIVRVDGVIWINFSGDTKNAGTSTNIDGLSWVAGSSSSEFFVDDLYVLNGTDDTATTGSPDNDFQGDVKIERCLPNANGDTNQFTGSDGNSTDNYLLVDESTPNTSDYVGDSVSGHRDLWNLEALPAGITRVYAVRAQYYAAKSDAGVLGFKPVIKENATTTVEASQLLSTTYTGYAGTLRKVKPSGGVFSVADVNATQIGVDVP